MTAERFVKGESVRVTFDGRTVDASVLIASGNGESLAVSFEAILGGYAGLMPVLWKDGEFQDLIKRRRVEIARV